MLHIRVCRVLLFLGSLLFHTPANAQIDYTRINEIASLLSTKPIGFGDPIEDRDTWDQLRKIPFFHQKTVLADSLLQKSIPLLSDSLYRIFTETGKRYSYQNPMNQRRSNLENLVLAECIENKGRYFIKIEKYLKAICNEPTWVYPAHDKQLDNLYGRVNDIDLSAALTSWRLGTVVYLLGEKLNPDLRNLVLLNVDRRVFTTYRTSLKNSRPLRWMIGTSNWNSVCHAGVIGAALALLEEPKDRALFIYGGEKYCKNYLNGFSNGGYCSEGLSYWNYGFGQYLLLTMAIEKVTNGQINFLSGDKWRNVAAFPINIEIRDRIYPAFADCPPIIEPDSQVMHVLNHRFGFGLIKYANPPEKQNNSIYEIAAFYIDSPATNQKPSKKDQDFHNIRYWFKDAGVLIARNKNKSGISVALKGGHNDEHHNHNDVGSFVVVLNGSPLLLDPGKENYTARTFSAQRYVSNVLNSYGHPVPVINNKLQKTGPNAKAVLLEKHFTSVEDKLVLDISSAYDVPALDKLVRTFIFNRKDQGSLVIKDTAIFSKPTLFENALITFDRIKIIDNSTLFIYDDSNKLEVKVESTDGFCKIISQQIIEDLPGGQIPLRIGLKWEKPVNEITSTITIKPAN